MDIKGKFEWLEDVPDELKSRKLVLILTSMFFLLLIAVVGTITSHFFGSGGLWQDAMLYITSLGGGGAVAQAVPDAVQAHAGNYRQGYYNNTEKVTANPAAPSTIIPVPANTQQDIVINYPPTPIVSTRTSFIDKSPIES